MTREIFQDIMPESALLEVCFFFFYPCDLESVHLKHHMCLSAPTVSQFVPSIMVFTFESFALVKPFE